MADEIKGVEELIRKLNRLEGGVAAGLGKVAMAGALTLEGVVKTAFNEGKHGRVYRRGQKIHTASAPGETPAIDYGFLLNSVQSELVSATNEHAEAQVTTNAEAAPSLEFGTARMEARPFMRPAVDQHEEDVQNAATATLKRIIDEAANA